MSMMHPVCMASYIPNPAKRYHVHVASSLRDKLHFRSCQAVSCPCCIQFAWQVPFQILPGGIMSMLHPVCVASSISNLARRYHAHVASSLRDKFHFRSCQAVSCPCCIKFAWQVSFPILPGSICLLYTSPSPRDRTRSRMPSSA